MLAERTRRYALRRYALRRYALRRYALRRYALRRYALRRYALRRYALRRRSHQPGSGFVFGRTPDDNDRNASATAVGSGGRPGAPHV